jgi:predicted dehydrogenase
MTERYEVTSQLQRVLVNTPEVFGELTTGIAAVPAIQAKSVHHVMKVVAGVPLHRPPWFFDLAEYGEALADVGTHAVDLVQWTAFPDRAIDYRKDVRVYGGRHWPLKVSKAQFQQVTGETDFPPALAGQVHKGSLDFVCNDVVNYTIRGVHVTLGILWNWEAAPGTGDVYESAFRGTLARVELRQGKAEKYVPEVYVVPAHSESATPVLAALRKKVSELQKQWPGLAVEETENGARLAIPERFRVGHEEHFAQVASQFFDYLRSPKSMPAWERPNMLAKYYVSTKGVEMSQ